MQSTISDSEIDYLEVNEPTLIPVPGYTNPVKFGIMYDFAMKVIGSGKTFLT